MTEPKYTTGAIYNRDGVIVAVREDSGAINWRPVAPPYVPKAEDPKARHGAAKPCIHYLPMQPMLDVARVMELGARKYGIKNWREQPVAASTYYSAMFRHLVAWFESLEEMDPESGEHHLAHVIASALLVLDSQERDVLVDDRAKVEVKRGA